MDEVPAPGSADTVPAQHLPGLASALSAFAPRREPSDPAPVPSAAPRRRPARRQFRRRRLHGRRRRLDALRLDGRPLDALRGDPACSDIPADTLLLAGPADVELPVDVAAAPHLLERETDSVVPPPRRGRRWVRGLAIATTLCVLLAGMVGGGIYLYARRTYDSVTKVALPDGVTRNRPIPAAGPTTPGQAATAVNILVVGSDTRQGLTGTDLKKFGTATDVGGQRSDTIIVMRIGSEGGLSALSIPRDLYVPIAGSRYSSRINSAFEKGPGALITTIKNALHIEIDYYVEVDFAGFQKVVAALGGVEVCLDGPVRDAFSSLDIKQGGCQKLDPITAMAYVRARHFQTRVNGRWQSDPTSDIGRIGRQQAFMRQVVKQAASSGIADPLQLNAVVQSVAGALTVDSHLSFDDMTRLARRLRANGDEDLKTLILPTAGLQGIKLGGKLASVLQLQLPAADGVLAGFRDDPNQKSGPLVTEPPDPNAPADPDPLTEPTGP